jgi:hypothetical protein
VHRALVLLLFSVGACAPAGVRTQDIAPSSEAGTFSVLRSTDTIATETFRRTRGSLDGELTAVQAGRFVFAATLAADGTAPRLEVRAYSGSAAGAGPAQHSVFTSLRTA